MSKYYDSDKYYSYHTQKHYSSIRNLVHRLVFKAYSLGLLSRSARYLRTFKKYSILHILKRLRKDTAILDIGCGDGNLIQEMSIWGWRDLTGIDPFIEKGILSHTGWKVLKQNIFEHSGKYDFIMLHHSLEHLDNQHEVFKKLYELLADDGMLYIRVPLCDSFAFRKYGSDWFQIDAPRHFFLHTIKSMTLLAESHGFQIKDIFYDSSAAQFINSEKYNMNVPLFLKTKKRATKKLDKLANVLNLMHDGDMACFLMTKKYAK
ncbi:MAG: class I SAM-dependent methyltransferase [Culturomica sp.]|nr:class I SAM-dependent methyltransferase [Culturomica sp.]